MNKKIVALSIYVTAVMSVIRLIHATSQAQAGSEIELSLSIQNGVFRLGEIIPLEATIVNNASIPVRIEGDSRYAVAIKIKAPGEKEFRRYVAPGPDFTLDGIYVPIQINPGQVFSSQNKVLWNSSAASQVRNLSADAAESYTRGQILTDYAFPKAGTYYVKAVAGVFFKGKEAITIESKPVQITVEEPQGEDLEVWNKIKNDGEFGHFLQEGKMTHGYHKPEDVERFQNEVDHILADYPNSLYAQPLRESLMKYRAAEAKREEFLKQPN